MGFPGTMEVDHDETSIAATSRTLVLGIVSSKLCLLGFDSVMLNMHFSSCECCTWPKGSCFFLAVQVLATIVLIMICNSLATTFRK